MIWEVDEDCDGLINWPEFQAMWQRCQEDKAGGAGMEHGSLAISIECLRLAGGKHTSSLPLLSLHSRHYPAAASALRRHGATGAVQRCAVPAARQGGCGEGGPGGGHEDHVPASGQGVWSRLQVDMQQLA